jgi:3-hydroxybutyryl-CoA dehydrogenase
MRIAVIGAGVQGRAFSLACAEAGLQVDLEDVMPERLRQAGVELGSLTGAVRLMGTVEDAVCDADLVVDFVPDELESKLEIWSLLDRMAPPRTVMCTPSANLSITDLASCTYRADRCVMLRGRLAAGAEVRILTARETSAATIETTCALLAGLGCGWVVEADPDLPMLLKNMHASML